jgi:UDP-galactopyranose mutase
MKCWKKFVIANGDKCIEICLLIVGAGLYGAVCARELTDAGKTCLIIEKRGHIAGNIYTKEVEGIHVHAYGGHIFHTDDPKIWDYMTRFSEFNGFINTPIANYKGELYNLPLT